MKARPTPRAFLLLLVAVAPAALAVGNPSWGIVALALDAMAIAFLLTDLWLGRSASAAIVRHDAPDRVQRSRPFEVAFRVDNPSSRALRVDVGDRLPPGFEPREWSTTLVVPPFGSSRIGRSVVPERRGERQLPPPAGESDGPFGLVRRRLVSGRPVQVTVLPNLRALREFDALLRQQRLQEMGIRNARERGQGTEVVGLRHYVNGDPFSGIDWKATARTSRPITRERQAERRQNVVLLLDAGRRMARESAGRSRLDTAVDAAILLAHAAMRADDRVGLMTFADKPLQMVAPLRNRTQAAALVRALVPLEAVPREPPYRSIAVDVLGRFPRRSLLVLFTDVAEPSSIEGLVGPARLLSRRHLLLCVFFEDPVTKAALGKPPANADELYRAGAAAQLATERQRGIRGLRQAGVLVLEAPAAHLPAAVVNEYLRIKARRLL